MGCGGSKDTISQKSPTGAQDLKQQVSEKDNPVVEHANLPSALGAEQLSPPTIIHETIQANDSNEIMAVHFSYPNLS